MSRWRRRKPSEDEFAKNSTPPPPMPRRAPREVLDDWLRALTILSEGHSPEETFNLIALVNQPGQHRVRIRTPRPADDAHAVEDALPWYRDLLDRQVKVNLAIESILIGWLAESTGQSRNQIVQRLAEAINRIQPPS